MGKLSDLWGDLKAESDPDKIKDIQKQITMLLLQASQPQPLD